jgi:spore germination protein GerM
MCASRVLRVVLIILIPLLLGAIFVFLFWWIKEEKTSEIKQVKVYFRKYKAGSTDCICRDPVIREIPKTRKTEKAAFVALDELIKGPSTEERAKGYGGCIPAGRMIAEYKEWYMKIVQAYHEHGGRADEFTKRFLSPEGTFTPWGDRVMVRGVRIKDGIAYADFSKELYSYGGGSCRVEAIESAIENTLRQFPGVEEVKILVEGKEAELQP